MSPCRQYHEQLVDMVNRADPKDFVLVSGTQWVYGRNRNGDVGFYLRPWADPLRDVSVMPQRLAKRIQEFAGGQVVNVPVYLGKLLSQVQMSL